jgi:chromosome partitioning protein
MGRTYRTSTYLDKGGTGKTTCTAHLGVALQQECDQDVLLIDLAGKQGDLAKTFGLWEEVQTDIENEDDFPNIATTMEENWANVVDLIGDPADAVEQLVYETGEGVDLIPAHPSLDALDADLGNVDDAQERYARLQAFLDEYVDPLDYSMVILDLPGVANNVTYNGLWATESVVAPVQMGPLEFEQARGLQTDLQGLSQSYGVDVELTMLIPNLYDRRTNLDKEVHDRFLEEFGDIVGPDRIVASQAIRKATNSGHTLFELEEDELTKTAREARGAFVTTAEELLTRLDNE